MLETLALAGLSGGLSALSSAGAAKASKKQAMLQAWADNEAKKENQAHLDSRNAQRRAYGQAILDTPEVTTETTYGHVTDTVDNTSTRIGKRNIDNYSYVDVDAMMKGAAAAGFNPATWLASGAMSAYTQTGSEENSYEYETSRNIADRFTDMSTTTTRTGHNAVAGYNMFIDEVLTAQASQVPKQTNAMELFGNAGQAALGTYMNLNKQASSQAFQKDLLAQQIAAIGGKNTSSGSYGGGMQATPSYSTSGGTTSTTNFDGVPHTSTSFFPDWSNSMLSNLVSGQPKAGGDETSAHEYNDAERLWALSSGNAQPTKTEIQAPKSGNPFSTWKVVPGWNNAEGLEDAYGDEAWAPKVYGNLRSLDDLTYNVFGYPVVTKGLSYANRAKPYVDMGNQVLRSGVMSPYSMFRQGYNNSVTPYETDYSNNISPWNQ